jgi:hypothetical protein
MNNKLGLKWLKHFNAHTKSYTIGMHHLLILDGHESHDLLDFKLYCKENKIVTICIPVYLLHLLQLLDVGCFSPIKKAYGHQVKKLMRVYINYITKMEFLLVFKAAFNALFTKSNICVSF